MATVDVINKTRVEIDLEEIRLFATSLLEAVKEYKDCEVCVSFVGDKKMQQLNERWRGIGTPTDVLSFSLDSPPETPGLRALGDIVIAPRQAIADAQEEGVSFKEKLQELVLHATLHLMGYDHETPQDARRMESRRKALLKKIGKTE